MHAEKSAHSPSWTQGDVRGCKTARNAPWGGQRSGWDSGSQSESSTGATDQWGESGSRGESLAMTASGQCITCVASRNALCHEHRRESLMGMRIIIDGRRKSYVPFIKCNLTCICTLQNSQAMLCGYFRRYLKNSHLKFYILQFYKILHCPFGKNLRYLPLPFLNTNSHDGHQGEVHSSVHDRAVKSSCYSP